MLVAPTATVFCAFLTVSQINAASYTATRNLEDYCGRTLSTSCPSLYGEAGTLRFYYMPSTSCKVTVSLSSYYCGTSYEYYSIYLNIRKSYMPSSSKMEIYDTSSGRTLGKSWDGGFSQAQNSNPTSAGQYLSKTTGRPEISIEFTPSHSYPPTSSHEVYFDYVLISDTYTRYNSHCPALNGYLNDNIICDTTDDRVNCPSSYSALVYNMDAATSRQTCSTTTTTGPTTTRTAATTTANYDYLVPTHGGLSAGAIVGIVVGCVAFVAIVIGVIVACAHRAPEVTEQKKAFTHNAYSAMPAVVFTQQGGFPPYPYLAKIYAPGPYPPGAMPQSAFITTTTTTTN
ncbi:uncharacterized protein LOC129595515 [Paramacrobiotus metropolitanus]|uniref:uncharacterized protein LOC129595515 n=1 Tax=Paramacrobiotus metropolitanus TaxID=2943436 RepID=UPI002445AB59|nr:uncharacterized protein LOC129595515 [Paramacrobiotus metropolitanus]